MFSTATKSFISSLSSAVIATCSGIQFLFSGVWVKMMSEEAKSSLAKEIFDFGIEQKADALENFLYMITNNGDQLGEISREMARCNQLLSEWKFIALVLGITGAIGIAAPHILAYAKARQASKSLHQFLGLSEFENLKSALKLKMDAMKQTQDQFLARVAEGKGQVDAKPKEFPLNRSFWSNAKRITQRCTHSCLNWSPLVPI